MQYDGRRSTFNGEGAAQRRGASGRLRALAATAVLPGNATNCWLEGPAWLLAFAVAGIILGMGHLPMAL